MQIPGNEGSGRSIRQDAGHSGIARAGKSQNETVSEVRVDHTSDSQVSKLRQHIADQGIRPEVISAAQHDLATGSLLTRESAEQTARSVIGIVNNF